MWFGGPRADRTGRGGVAAWVISLLQKTSTTFGLVCGESCMKLSRTHVIRITGEDMLAIVRLDGAEVKARETRWLSPFRATAAS